MKIRNRRVQKRLFNGLIPPKVFITFGNMKTISILIPKTAVASGVTAARYLFTTANQFLQASGKEPLFKVQMVGTDKEIRIQDGAYSITTDAFLEDSGQADLVIIPPIFGDMQTALALNEDTIPWITKQRDMGAEVASLCIGAFLLASTGMLNGKKCSTHWAFYNEFKEMFPEVEVVDGGVITEENGIYSSGGANSIWNLLLYLLEKYTDRDMAILASKYFAIDIDRDSQAAFMMFTGQKDHNDEQVKQAQEYIETNYHEKMTVDELAEMVAVSRRSFERRFKQATNNTVVEYLQRVKIEAAKRSFESTRKNITEVMFDVGYTDSKAFRNVFKKITGLTPIEYRNKYNKDVTAIA
ncbi:helix-turn-helix domain-containing protein [Allomuricauda taeanensis]|uniref:GlxA family transcriptional regulator n=1 Tax=Flagellimonas taeanensis TaxID=1005926 RepID=UPI002E7B3957|nr:helix-turn-helix domain-containing protein [Allomuricauda taeanensis]MEE1964290.1 helix-turn-helix domain-containing protein [Allomuricauda taeanensis]